MLADLLDIHALVDENDDWRYLLVIIDIITRMVWIEKIKIKSA